MKKGILPLVVGNWKMNPETTTLAAKLATDLKKRLHALSGVDVVIAPAHTHLGCVKAAKNSSKAYALGAQNVSHEKNGTHTGEVSLHMLNDFGVTHVILGHSERRVLGETDALINQKLIATVKAGLVGIVCVGESKRDHLGHYLSRIEIQIQKAFATISRTKLEHVVVAYEPVWAIGTGNNATAEDIHEMKLFIEKVLSDMYGRNYAQKVRIIYGGSVCVKNAKELFEEGMIDGFLVGGASLRTEEFVQIVKAVQTV